MNYSVIFIIVLIIVLYYSQKYYYDRAPVFSDKEFTKEDITMNSLMRLKNKLRRGMELNFNESQVATALLITMSAANGLTSEKVGLGEFKESEMFLTMYDRAYKPLVDKILDIHREKINNLVRINIHQLKM